MHTPSNTFIVASQAAGYAAYGIQGDFVQAFDTEAFQTQHDDDWARNLADVELFTTREEAQAVLDELFSDDPAFDWEVMSVEQHQQITGVDYLIERVEELN